MLVLIYIALVVGVASTVIGVGLLLRFFSYLTRGSLSLAEFLIYSILGSVLTVFGLWVSLSNWAALLAA